MMRPVKRMGQGLRACMEVLQRELSSDRELSSRVGLR